MERTARYGMHPGLAHMEAIAGNLETNTGRALADWIRLVDASGVSGSGARAQWLQREHGLGQATAGAIAEYAERGGLRYDPDGLVERLFAGPKAGLRPLYDALLDLAFMLGADVTVTPCATMVPIRRRHVIAQIRPSTKTRIDFGLALKGAAITGDRLIDTGGLAKGDRITHRIPITAPGEIDAEVRHWLRTAYELDA